MVMHEINCDCCGYPFEPGRCPYCEHDNVLPDWHDRPTGPGIWYLVEAGEVETISDQEFQWYGVDGWG